MTDDQAPPPRSLMHAFNNPLASLMAELQLLQMLRPDDAEVQAGLERALLQVRRLRDLGERLKGIPE
jgi:signal transduction histidine kinase